MFDGFSPSGLRRTHWLWTPQPLGEILLLIRCRCSNGRLPMQFYGWLKLGYGRHQKDRSVQSGRTRKP
jgi:hypothetical protein